MHHDLSNSLADVVGGLFTIVVLMIGILYIAAVNTVPASDLGVPQVPTSRFRESVGLNDKIANVYTICENRVLRTGRAATDKTPEALWYQCFFDEGAMF